jgi:hypothetical protein
MKKALSLALIMALMFAPVAFALDEFEYDQNKVVIGVEYGAEEQDVDEVDIIDVNIGNELLLNANFAVSDLEVQTYLATLGYELSEYLIPYAIVGVANIELDSSLRGHATVVDEWTHGGDLLKSSYDSTDFAYGAGAKGVLAKVKDIILSYDARILRTTGEDDAGIQVVPAHTDIVIDNDIEVEYTKTQLALLASKIFILEDVEFLKSVAPYVGYRISKIDLNVKNGNVHECIEIDNETNYEGVNHDVLLGAEAQVNDQWSVNVAAVLGDSMGMSAGATFRF